VAQPATRGVLGTSVAGFVLGGTRHDGGGYTVEKLTALEAHREGRLSLPPGYVLEHGADVLLLRRRDGSVAATFSARGVNPVEVTRTAQEDQRANGRSSA
jgi:hypothetical protein